MFDDRSQAGALLATRLGHLAADRPIVLGLPRGGVPVAYEVAGALDAPLDVIIVRKLGVPFQPELGMGAIGEDGVRVLTDEIVRLAHVTEIELAAVERRERAEVDRRMHRYRHGAPMISLQDRTVVVVDDGIATGGTMRAALQIARAHGAKKVVLAVPVAAPDTVQALRPQADEVVVLEQPTRLVAIGHWYRDFRQVPDEEVVRLLDAAARSRPHGGSDPVRTAAVPLDCIDAEVDIPLAGVVLSGHLTVPDGAQGVVVFAHGSGSSRHSPRNRSVAELLHEHGIGTLLFDLLTEHEAIDRSNVFDIDLLALRLAEVTAWSRTSGHADDLKIGYFGASTGAAAALRAATMPGNEVAAIVSRGGRPDLALGVLAQVTAPTLLIVGSRDELVLDLNRRAAESLRCEHHLAVVSGATHLFEEPGALRRAALLAQDWFTKHFRSPAAAVDSSGAGTQSRPTGVSRGSRS